MVEPVVLPEVVLPLVVPDVVVPEVVVPEVVPEVVLPEVEVPVVVEPDVEVPLVVPPEVLLPDVLPEVLPDVVPVPEGEVLEVAQELNRAPAQQATVSKGNAKADFVVCFIEVRCRCNMRTRPFRPGTSFPYVNV
ncbi:hypothetical protein [Hymenobacter weizhouensis]|uniref:hypothetical protein n=1 Tax=Hymenobacter sp. YIM 151500-1 TaxID=2987689 RepID=UPI0022272B47|nr:hypothetical protein [Hymenobacter sp. YIM 151500-1]UYZ64642.1 hypothetical protein OIS53_07270 [Hymenobacter sp. YIM 151500-1]